MSKDKIVISYYPMDSRIGLATNGVFQTLNARMGTGGGNVPLVLEIEIDDGDRKEQTK